MVCTSETSVETEMYWFCEKINRTEASGLSCLTRQKKNGEELEDGDCLFIIILCCVCLSVRLCVCDKRTTLSMYP